jgi:hypothetical protein
VRIGVYVGILACAVLLFAAAKNDDHPDAQSKILALEHAWDQAQERGDIKALGALFDDSLVFIDYDGKILTKMQYLDRVRSDSSHVRQIVTDLPGYRCGEREALLATQALYRYLDAARSALDMCRCRSNPSPSVKSPQSRR